MLPSASTLSIICRREYSLTVDAIKKQLPSRNKVRLALERWTSMNKLAIIWVIAYNMVRNWALREVQLAFDEVDNLLFAWLESQLRMIGQGSTCWGKAIHTFGGSTWSFWAYWQLLFGITTDNTSSNCSMTRELQSTLQASGIQWPALGHHLPCLAHVIQLALGAFMSSLGVEGCIQSLEAHERA